MEPQYTVDIYTTVPSVVRQFLYIPDITSVTSATFSARFETEEQLLASLRGIPRMKVDEKLEALSQKLESLQKLSQRLIGKDIYQLEKLKRPLMPIVTPKLKETKKIEIVSEKRGLKVEKAIKEYLPKKRGRPRKEKEEPIVRRKRFAIKKVAPIKTKREK